jgi:hypothetical protein
MRWLLLLLLKAIEGIHRPARVGALCIPALSLSRSATLSRQVSSARYSQTWSLRTGLYRNSYLFGIASLALQIFAGYIGKSCYKLLRNNIVIFFGVFRYNKIIVFGRKSCRFVRYWGPLLYPFLHQNSVLTQQELISYLYSLLAQQNDRIAFELEACRRLTIWELFKGVISQLR